MSRTFFNLAEIETEWLQSETVMDRLALIPGGMRRGGGGGGGGDNFEIHEYYVQSFTRSSIDTKG